MKKSLFLTALVCSLFLYSTASAFSGCEEDCQKCHTMDKKEAKQILNSLKAFDAEPLDIKISPIKGLWEVTIDSKGSKGIVYVGFSKKHVIRGPIFEIDTGINETQKILEKLKKETPRYVDYPKIPLESAPLLGNPDAPHKVVVFTDPDCSYCAKLHEELKKVTAKHDNIAFSIKLFPLSFHPDAYWKSQTVICSGSLKYLEDNFHKKPIPKPDCETGEIDENIKLAREFGITGTPTMIMPDGLIVVGFRDAESIRDLVLNRPEKEAVK